MVEELVFLEHLGEFLDDLEILRRGWVVPYLGASWCFARRKETAYLAYAADH